MVQLPPFVETKYRFRGQTERYKILRWMLKHAHALLFLEAPALSRFRPMTRDSIGLLQVLARLPVAGERCKIWVRRLASNSGEPPDSWYMQSAIVDGKNMMTFALSEIANARDPSTTFYGVLAALLLSHIHWHPGHPLASDTAFRIDFGHDMTESEGVAALRALLVQCMDDDIDAADKLVAGFAIIPPHAVRNGLILFVPACASESALPNMALVFAAISTDPPSFSTALEHEAFRIPLLCDAVSSTTVEQLVSVQDRGHSDRPFQSRIVLTFSPASGVPDPCPACRLALAKESKQHHVKKNLETLDREWGLVVRVPAFLAAAADFFFFFF